MYEFERVKGAPRTYTVLSYGMNIGTIYAHSMGYYVFTWSPDFTGTPYEDAEEVAEIKSAFDDFLYRG